MITTAASVIIDPEAKKHSKTFIKAHFEKSNTFK